MDALAGGWEIGDTAPEPSDLVLDVMRGVTNK
jgi:hypothetical protein